MEKGEIILYQPDNSIELEVRIEAETVWLTQAQMALLFGCSTDNVGLHLKNIYDEQEIDPISTAEEISVVCKEGKTRVCKESLPTASTIAKFATVQKESNVHFLHIGASLKDLGKKLLAFSKLEISPAVILNVVSKT